MKQSRQVLLIVVILLAILETTFVGCGGSGSSGGGESSYQKANTEASKPKYNEVTVSSTGSLYLRSSSGKSSIKITADDGTVSSDANVTLIERALTANENKLFGNNCSNVYRLVAVSESNSGLLSSKTNIEQANKPMTIEISNSFPQDISDFYLGTRRSEDSDWQYTKLQQTGLANYSNISSNSRASIHNSIRAVASISYTFTINTTTFGDEIAVFGDSVASSSLESVNTITNMDYSTDLPYLDLKYDANGDYVYNTDLVINTCMTAEKSASIFSGATVQTQISFNTAYGTEIENLVVVGKTTQYATQDVTDAGGGLYTHTIYFDDYLPPEIKGLLATYSFTLKTRNHQLNQIPATFTFKSIIIDKSIPIAFASEDTQERELVLSYLSSLSPVDIVEPISCGASLSMKYIAHDIASVTVSYTYPGVDAVLSMPGIIDVDDENKTISFLPARIWPPNTYISATATAFCCVDHGANGVRKTFFSFVTEEASDTPIVIGSDTFDPASITMIVPNPRTNVATISTIVLKFSEDIDWDVDSYKDYISLSSDSIQLLIATPTFDPVERTLTFYAMDNLCYNSRYTVRFNSLTDQTNLKYIKDAIFTFSTEDGEHAQASITPTDDSIVDGIYVPYPTFIVDFGTDISKSNYINENLIAKAFNDLKVYRNGLQVYSDKIAKNWIEPYRRMQIKFIEPIISSSTYKIVMGNTIRDYQNLIVDPFPPFYFVALPEISSKLVTPASPIDAPIDTLLQIEFESDIYWVSSYSSKIYFYQDKALTPIASYTYEPSNFTLTMVPKEPLLYNASYTILLLSGLRNGHTLQYIASNAYYFETCDGPHYNATVSLASGSLYNGKSITNPTIMVDFGATVMNYNAAKTAVRLKRKGVEIGATASETWTDSFSKLYLTYSLVPEATYTITLDPGLRTTAGNYIDPFETFTFNTVDNISSKIISPENDIGVATSTKIVFQFSDDIAWTGSTVDKGYFSLYRGYTNVSPEIDKFVYASNTHQLTIIPKYLYYNASYTIALVKGLENKRTGQQVASISFYFETENGEQALATAQLTPESVLDGKAIINPTITVDFKKPVMSYTEAQENIGLWLGNTLMKSFTRKWSKDKSKVDFVFSSTALLPDTTYTLKMKGLTLDYEGVPITPFADYTFTTVGDIIASMTTPNPTTNVATTTEIVVNFSNDIDWTQSEDSEKIVLRLEGQEIPIKKYYYDNKNLTLTPRIPLILNATYYLWINEGLKNSSTGQKVATTTFSFSTIEGNHSKASISIDRDSIIDDRVIPSPILYVNFGKDILNIHQSKALEGIKVYQDRTEIKDIKKTWMKPYNQIRIIFNSKLAPDTEYWVHMEESVRDVDGAFIDPFDDLTFKTEDKIDFDLTSPADKVNVATNTPIIFTFNKHIDWGAGYKVLFTLRIGDAVLGIKSFTYNSNNETLTLVPENELLYNTTYTIDVKAGMKNNTTKQETQAKSFTFKTVDGTLSKAVLIVPESCKIDDMIIVDPTFIVDFGRTVLDATKAANSVEIYKGTSKVTKLSKTWLANKRQLQIQCASGTTLDSDKEYVIRMSNSVQDYEGNYINPFDEYLFTTTPNGSGTKLSPFLIYTAAQLDNVRKKPQCWYRLKRDIDIATTTYKSSYNDKENGWFPIGTVNTRFTGGFDGDGHRISGLSINRPMTDSVGLFGQVEGAEIKNLYVENGIVIGDDSVGSIIGYAYNSTLTYCCNENITVKGNSHVGGLFGEIYSSTATRLRNSGDVYALSGRAGGIVGWNNIQSSVVACWNTGAITGETEHIAGIAGYNNALVDNCYNTGAITGYQYIGGIVGSNNNPSAKVRWCLAVGNILPVNFSTAYSRGIAGYNESAATIESCAICSQTYINGVACTDVAQIVWNFYEGTHENNNNFFTSVSDLNQGLSNNGIWNNSECFSGTYWRLRPNDVPTMVSIP